MRLIIIDLIYYQFLKTNIISMKKTQYNNNKQAHPRKSKECNLSSPPKKQFQLLYRERDPQHSQEPYENIIFMKSKKCDKVNTTKRKSENKLKNQPVQELQEMVAQIEKQFKAQKQKQNRKLEDHTKSTLLKPSNLAKNIFKNKEIKQTFHSKASSRWLKYKKQENLSTENVKKYKNMLSPSRNIRCKEGETLSSKFLKSTQQTFRKQTKSKQKKKLKTQNYPPLSDDYKSNEPEEYVFLENNFIEVSHEDANILHQKITSNKQVPLVMVTKKLNQSIKNEVSCFQEQSNQWSQYLINSERQQKDQSKVENENLVQYQKGIDVMQRFLESKIKLIQRWWRKCLREKKQEFLSPIIFQQQKTNNEEMNQSMLFINNNLIKQLHVSEVSPIKMIDNFHQSKQDHFVEEKDPFLFRERAAEQQLQTHLQLLNQLLSSKKISPEIFFQKKMLIQAKYHNQLQHIEQLKKIMMENTQRAYEINKKTHQDKTKLQNIQTQIDQKTLDQIFGKDFCNVQQSNINNGNYYNTLPLNYEMMVVNRQKSTGCHYDGEGKVKPSIYQKRTNEQDQYEQDFQEEQSQEERQVQNNNFNIQENTYNSNFNQLLDQYKARQEVKMEIDKRTAIQLGALIEDIPQQILNQHIGIDTSLNTIHRFILSFFKFYIFYYKDQFLKLINMPYGFNIDKRLQILHGYDQDLDYPSQDENGIIYGLETIISDQILDQFYEKIYDLNVPMSTVKRNNFQFEKIHNRALLDSFNEALNYFRPYFLLNGPPYPWSRSQKALTFYYIAEQNIQEVFQKTQFKVLKWASNLCGLIINKYTTISPSPATTVQQTLESYKNLNHPDITETRQDRLTKNQKIQIIESNGQWGIFQQQSTVINVQTSDYIFSKLIQEYVLQFYLKDQYSQKDSSFSNILHKNFDYFQHLSEEQQSLQF